MYFGLPDSSNIILILQTGTGRVSHREGKWLITERQRGTDSSEVSLVVTVPHFFAPGHSKLPCPLLLLLQIREMMDLF